MTCHVTFSAGNKNLSAHVFVTGSLLFAGKLEMLMWKQRRSCLETRFYFSIARCEVCKEWLLSRDIVVKRRLQIVEIKANVLCTLSSFYNFVWKLQWKHAVCIFFFFAFVFRMWINENKEAMNKQRYVIQDEKMR